MSFNEKKRNEFLDIPYAEHIVPFPNFATVIMQHAREFPDKIALGFNSRSYTYFELIKTCLALDLNSNITLSMKDPENDLIIILALLVQGISFKLDFKADTILQLDKIKQGDLGKSISRLVPAGKALFGDEYYEVHTYGTFIDQNTKIEVVKIENNKIFVKQTKS